MHFIRELYCGGSFRVFDSDFIVRETSLGPTLFEVFADDARYEVRKVLAVGEDFIVAAFSLSGTGARSQLPLELRWAGVTWFRDGKATRAVGYGTPEEALRAAGVEA